MSCNKTLRHLYITVFEWIEKFCKHNNWLVGGGCVGRARARTQQTWSVLFFISFFFFPSEPTLVFTSRPVSFMGRDGGGGERGGTRKGTIVQLLLLCWFHPWLRTPVVLALHHQHPSTLGLIRASASLSSQSQRGPGAHQWCLCCSSGGGHLLAESESRSTLGMELSSPRYQDCEERGNKRGRWRD